MATITFEPVGPATAAAPSAAKEPIEVIANPKPAERSMSDSVRERLAALRDGPPPKAAPAPAANANVAPEPKPDDGVATSPEATDSEPGDLVPLDTKPTPAPAPEWHAERDELTGITQRQREIIAKLEADLESARKSSSTDIAERSKRLDEAGDLYVRDPVGAARKWLASSLGLDPDSEDATKELTDLYIDLTAHITGATPDTAHQAKRVSDLTRREWDRTTKRREQGEKKQAETVAPSEQGDQNETAISLIKTEFAKIADKYPHLTDYAEEFDGRPEAILWQVIDKGFRDGTFKRDEQDDVLIAKAAKLAETHYEGRWKRLEAKAAKRKPSPATPGVPPAPKQGDTPQAEPAKTVERQSNGRGLSNAVASVAPSKTPTPEPAKKPLTDKERQHRALRFLRGETE